MLGCHGLVKLVYLGGKRICFLLQNIDFSLLETQLFGLGLKLLGALSEMGNDVLKRFDQRGQYENADVKVCGIPLVICQQVAAKPQRVSNDAGRRNDPKQSNSFMAA